MGELTLLHVLDTLRANGQSLPKDAAALFFGVAARLAAFQEVALRPQLILLDEEDGVVLDLKALEAAETRPEYLAPEVASGAVPKTAARALVYAAGALGFELMTGERGPASADALARLGGPLGPVLRRALEGGYGGLADLRESLVPRDPPRERKLAAGLQKLVARLESGAAAVPEVKAARPPPLEPPRPRSSIGIGRLAGAAVAGAAIALATVAVVHQRSTPVRAPAGHTRPLPPPTVPRVRVPPVPPTPPPPAPPKEVVEERGSPKPPPAEKKEASPGAAAVSRGEKSLRRGKTDDALAAFLEALAAEPDLPAAVRGLGMVYMMQGKEAEAKQQYRRYLKLAPRARDAARIRKLVANLGSSP